jgi:hypothetical protein
MVMKMLPLGEHSDSFLQLVERLSMASTRRRWEAYRDVGWDDRENEVHRDDPRWEAQESWDPLATSPWYRDQSPETRSAIGLCRHARLLKVGIQFEAALSQGLLGFAGRLPNRHPMFRYVYHELAEEAQHSMMFQEVIDRSGFDPPGCSTEYAELFRQLVDLGEDLPALFFLAVLSGEESFDFIQRKLCASSSTHPLIARVSRIHVIEEARHVSFAQAYLRDVVPRMSRREIRELRHYGPVILDLTASHLFEFTGAPLVGFGMPDDVRQAIADDPRGRTIRRASMARVARLCDELGLIDRRRPDAGVTAD